MDHLNVGNETLRRLNRIGLGGTRMAADPEEGVRTIHAALDAGVNYLNVADFYSQGQIEMIFGEALKTRRREDVFISVKFGMLMSPDNTFYGIDNRPEHVKNYLAYSLKRLGTDYIDLYQPARTDPNIPIEETIGAIADLVQAGYVRHIGLSQTDAATLRKANAVHPIHLVEMQYSLLNRLIEDELLPTVRELGIGVVAYGVLFSGLMGAGTRDEKLSAMSRWLPEAGVKQMNEGLNLFDILEIIAKKKGITMAQLAIAWVLAQGDDILALVGSRKVSQIEDSLKALDVSLTPQDLERIEQFVPRSQTPGYLGLKLDIDEKGLLR